MSTRATPILLLCAICAVVPGPMAAQEADDEATRLLELANALYIRGPAYYGQAVIQYKAFLNQYPNHEGADEATFFLASCLRKQGKNQEALRYLLDHQKFRESPRRDEADFRTGQVYFSLNKYAEAVRYFLRLYSKKEKLDENLAIGSAFWLGWAYLKNDQAKEAVPVLVGVADGKENPLVSWANFHLGYAYRGTGELDKAIRRFQKAADALPERKAESLFMVAEAYAKQKDYKSAYGAYRELVLNHGDSPFHGRAAFGAVWSVYSDKDYLTAIQVYEICRKHIPPESQAEAAYIVANCYYETNKLNEALQTYQTVSRDFREGPFAARADYKACWCLFLLNRFDEVIVSGDSFVKKYPAYEQIADVYFLLGESLYERNRINEALSHYLTVVARYPTCRFREKASFKLGLCYLSTGQLESARKAFRAFATSFSTNELAPKALARSAECGLQLASKAKPKLQPAQYEEVARDYRALVEKYPKDALAGEALYQLGVTYAKLNQHDNMIEAYTKLVKEYPKNPNLAEAYYWLASESEKGEEHDKAIHYFERSLALKSKGPYSEQAKRRLADVYYKKGDKQKAADLIVEVLRENPQSEVPEQTHLWAGDFLLQNGKYPEATEVYELFLRKFQTTPRREGAYYGLGECHFRQGKWQAAVASYARAIEFEGEWVTLSRLNSGIAHLKLGRRKEAEEFLNEVAKSRVFELEAKATYWLGNMHFDLAKQSEKSEEKAQQYNLARGRYIRVVIFYTDSELRPECMYRVAECLEQEGLLQEENRQLLLEQAKKQLQELMETYPESEFAEKARAKLGLAPASVSGQ